MWALADYGSPLTKSAKRPNPDKTIYVSYFYRLKQLKDRVHSPKYYIFSVAFPEIFMVHNELGYREPPQGCNPCGKIKEIPSVLSVSCYECSQIQLQ